MKVGMSLVQDGDNSNSVCLEQDDPGGELLFYYQTHLWQPKCRKMRVSLEVSKAKEFEYFKWFPMEDWFLIGISHKTWIQIKTISSPIRAIPYTSVTYFLRQSRVPIEKLSWKHLVCNVIRTKCVIYSHAAPLFFANKMRFWKYFLVFLQKQKSLNIWFVARLRSCHKIEQNIPINGSTKEYDGAQWDVQ